MMPIPELVERRKKVFTKDHRLEEIPFVSLEIYKDSDHMGYFIANLLNSRCCP